MNINTLIKSSSIAKTRLLIFVTALILILSALLQIAGLPHWVTGFITLLPLALLFLAHGALSTLSQNLQKITSVCSSITEGNLEKRLSTPLEPHGEIADLRNALNNAIDMVDSFLREAYYATSCSVNKQFYRTILERGLNGSFKQVSILMNGTLKQAEEKEESLDGLIHLADDRVSSIAAATQEFSSSIDSIKNQVKQATSITESAQDTAGSINQNIDDLLKKLEETSDIMTSIQKITEQTNLLALNASIEAARAGEAGKGFAVVADEVRQLAQQTDTSTQSVSNLMDSIQSGVNDTHNNTSIMNTNVEEMAKGITNISSALEEQSLASDDIAQNATTITSEIAEFGRKN